MHTPDQESHARFEQPGARQLEVFAAVTAEFGARLRQAAPPERACDGQLTVHRWTLTVGPAGIAALARDVGRAYITDAVALDDPPAHGR